MWALVMFDLPVDTKKHRTEATRYRTYLLNMGFSRVQLSVYVRYLISSDGMDWLCSHINYGIPDGGEVRLIAVTDAEWKKSIVFEGKKLVVNDDAPEQLTIF